MGSTDRMHSPVAGDYARTITLVLLRLAHHEGETMALLSIEGEAFVREFTSWATSAPPDELRHVRFNAAMNWARRAHEAMAAARARKK